MERLTYEQKLTAVEHVLVDHLPLTSVAQTIGVSRQCLYKWIQRYQYVLKRIPRTESTRCLFLRALSDQYPLGSQHWKSTGSEVRRRVVEVATSHPLESLPRLLTRIPRKRDG